MTSSKTCIIACSGGPDSQALLHILATLKKQGNDIPRLYPVGVNHQLRPEAEKELQLATQLASYFNLPFETITVDIGQKGNLSAEARRLRYLGLFRAAEQQTASHVITGHHADDQLETMLMKLIRGAGLDGISGMEMVNEVNVLRPLLSTTSEEIHTYLSNHEIPYAQDPTNRSLEQHRTKIRHQVVPVLREIRAAAAINANRSAQLLQTDRDFIDDMAATAYARCSLKGPSLAMDKFLREHPSLKHRILVCWLTQACGISRPALTSDSLCQMQGWLSKSPRGQFDLQRKRFEVAQNRLWLELPIDLQQVPLLNEPSVAGQKDLPWLGVSAQYQISGPLNAQTPNHDIHQEAFDLDALKGPLTFRTRRNGDRVKCFDERAGSITIGNLFTNSKIPKSIRNHWPILTDANGEILWVLGLRRGREAPITQNTQKVLIVTITGCIPTSVA